MRHSHRMIWYGRYQSDGYPLLGARTPLLPRPGPDAARPGPDAAPGAQPLRQTTQPALWSEATIRQPAGACGQLAVAGCPAAQPASTTVVPGGGDCKRGSNGSSSVQETSNTCGTHSVQASEEVKATRSPGRSLPASVPGPPASTRAATRYAVSSGLASGMTC